MERGQRLRGLAPLLALALLVTAGAAPSAASEAPEPARVPGELIVGFVPGISRAASEAAIAHAGARPADALDAIDAALVRVAPEAAKLVEARLARDPRVRYVEPNYLVTADDHGSTPNDPDFHQLWGLHNFGQTVNGVAGTADADIDAKEAWGVATGSSSVVVGVIDTGVDFTHPDLAGRQWTNPGESGGGKETNGVDDDGNGYVDDWRGWDWNNGDNDPYDDGGHGTHVAGTIGAVGNNGTGVTGVNWNVRIMALKFLGSGGGGTTANAAKAVLYAASKGAHVSNNSWGGGGFSQALLDAILYADASDSLFVASAGNSNADNDASARYPSTYDAPNIISVAATDSADAKASFSNYGRRTVDLGAPGNDVYSTLPSSDYGFLSGTSMAAPHVSGTVALARAAHSGASDLGLKALLFSTVDPNLSLAGRTRTGGRLNANTAVRCSGAPSLTLEAPAPAFRADAGQTLAVKVIAATCASPAGVTVAAEANGSAVALTARGDGLWEGTFTAPADGEITVTATATAGSTTATASASGIVFQNYRFEDVPFAWIDATAGGTNLNITSDDGSASVTLPFPFVYYGQSFPSMRVSANGYVVFGPSSATAYLNEPIPSASAPNGLAAPFWDDLNPSVGGSIWTRTVGTAPNRSFVVEWLDVPHYPNVGNVTFQLVLREHQNDVLFQYWDTVVGDASLDRGRSASVGVETLDGLGGKQFSFDQATLGPYEQAKGLRFTMAAAGWSGPTVTTAVPLPAATLAVAYGHTMRASGGSLPLSWSVAAGSPPPGIGLGSSDGKLTGTPTATGTFSFVARVADAAGLANERPFSITVGTGVVITTASLPGGQVGLSYATQLQAAGGTTLYSWGVAGGSLPSGLSLNSSTGTISGTPSTLGTFSFTIRVRDSASPAREATKSFSIAIAPAPLEIVTSALTDGTLTASYYDKLAAKGGKTPYSWRLSGGSLPPGLTMSSAGEVSGTPTELGTFDFTVSVTDSDSPAQTATKTVTLKVSPAPLAIATPSLPDAKVRRSYSAMLGGRGGIEPYSWALASGGLPPGLSLDGATGAISGRPTSTGTFSFTVLLTDSQSPTQETTKPLSIKVVR